MNTAEELIAHSLSEEGMKHPVLTQVASDAQYILDHRRTPVGVVALNMLRDLYSQVVGWNLTMHQVECILQLQPRSRIVLANGDISDPIVREEMLGALSRVVLNCEWPPIDHMDDAILFTTLLHEQFKKLLF